MLAALAARADAQEEDEARTEALDTVLTYPSSSFDLQRMTALITSVGKRELMREARIAMRTVDAVWAGQEVSDEGLKRIADAAERISSNRRKREEDENAAVAWLKAKRDEIGLTALAKMLGVDAANLGKVIEGRRKPAATGSSPSGSQAQPAAAGSTPSGSLNLQSASTLRQASIDWAAREEFIKAEIDKKRANTAPG